MNDIGRDKLDLEICRLCDKLKNLEPGTDNYKAVNEQLVKLTDLANKDDESRNKFIIERDKLDHEASLESSKRGAESEKLEIEQRQKNEEAKRSYIQLGISCAVTAFTFIGTWYANYLAQSRSEYFEATGHAYTSRFNRWQMKEPMHPNLPPRK